MVIIEDELTDITQVSHKTHTKWLLHANRMLLGNPCRWSCWSLSKWIPHCHCMGRQLSSGRHRDFILNATRHETVAFIEEAFGSHFECHSHELCMNSRAIYWCHSYNIQAAFWMYLQCCRSDSRVNTKRFHWICNQNAHRISQTCHARRRLKTSSWKLCH